MNLLIILAALAGLPPCSDKVTHEYMKGWNVQALPTKGCIMNTERGSYICKRDSGCNKYLIDPKTGKPYE